MVSLENSSSNSDDSSLKSTLDLVKNIIPDKAPCNPPVAHGKSPSALPPYGPGVPPSPSQGSLVPMHTPMMLNPCNLSPSVGRSGSNPVNLSINAAYQPPFFGIRPNGLHQMPPMMNLRPAHLKEKTTIPHHPQVTSFGEAVSFCVQKHMDVPPNRHNPPLPPRPPPLVPYPQGLPPTPAGPVSLTGLPHGVQPSLPLPTIAQPPRSQSPPKKRSRRKNPNPVSIKRTKIECYERFEAPNTPPPSITEPSIEVEQNLTNCDEDEDLMNETPDIPEKVIAVTPVSVKQEVLEEESSPLPEEPTTPNGFTNPFIKDEPVDSPELPDSLPIETSDDTPPFTNENTSDQPFILNVESLSDKVKQFDKYRRQSFESTSAANSPTGGYSEDSEYETYANKPRHKCTFCEPSTSFSYCNDLLMHLYNQHKEKDCADIQTYILDTVPVLNEQVLADDNNYYAIASSNDQKNGNLCKICLRRLPSRYMFVLHMCSHTGERPYKCDYCTKRFVDGVTLWKHKKVHMNEHPEIMSPKAERTPGGKPYHCDECGKGFLHQGSLSNHRKLHIGWKPYRCEGCGKEFTRNASLMIHMRSHTKETPFKCQLCGRGFTQSCNLNTHLRIHRGEKPFPCTVCGKNFSRKFVLQKHRCLPGIEPVPT